MAAYVIAQHLGESEHGQLLGRLLHRESQLPVVVASPGEALEADKVYLLPAGGDCVVRGGRLKSEPSLPDSLSRPSVSRLFESLAQAYGPRAIGLVLSGTGSDGVAGCRAIRAAGGLTLAQDPASARFPAMPQAALEAGVVEGALEPRAMARRLASLGPCTPYVPVLAPQAEAPPDELGRVLKLIRSKTGLDFTSYKEETLLRRLKTRLANLNLPSLPAYVLRLERDPNEAELIANQFLISRSSFFRDRECFEALERLLGQRLSAGRPFQVWVPGCATGEECYTLSIVAFRLLGERSQVQILGTDLNARALDQARLATYPESSLEEVEPDVKETCFLRSGPSYQVLPRLRACCEFRLHDVVSSEPPGQFDLISCRNLLIYLKSELQQELLMRFHAALRPDGLLFLGLSETITVTAGNLFRAVDAAHKLYQRRSG